MLSITGIVCTRIERPDIENWFDDWEFLNLNWKDPLTIDVPILSIKERLHLEKELPTRDATGHALSDALEYKIEEDDVHLEQLKQYEQFHQYYPYFARVWI